MISRPHHDPLNHPVATKLVWGGPMVDIINPNNFGINRSIHVQFLDFPFESQVAYNNLPSTTAQAVM